MVTGREVEDGSAIGLLRVDRLALPEPWVRIEDQRLQPVRPGEDPDGVDTVASVTDQNSVLAVAPIPFDVVGYPTLTRGNQVTRCSSRECIAPSDLRIAIGKVKPLDPE